jgi:Zn-dependent protease
MANTLYTLSTFILPLMLAIVFHEVAHGWTARYFGDMTAANKGRLTLNPVRHVDPFGTVILPGLLAISGAPIFGWAKPVPVIPSRLNNPRRDMMIVAFAGPASNFILAFITTAILALSYGFSGGEASGAIGRFIEDNLFNFLLINVFLGFFNLLPMPPFDGGHIVEGLLPRSALPLWEQMRKYGIILLFVLLLGVPLLFPEARIVERLVLPPVTWLVEFYLGLFGLNG